MNPDESFFFIILTFQAVFTGAIVLLVGRRYPGRLPAYRWIAPAAVPALMFALAATAWAFGAAKPEPSDLARLLVAYLVLWLAGVVWAGMIARWSGRR